VLRLRFVDLLRFVRTIRASAPWLFRCATAGSVGLALATPAIAYTSMRMFDAILVEGSERGTIVWMALEIVLAVAIVIFTCLQRDAARLLRDPLSLALSTTLARRLERIPLSDLESEELAPEVARARELADQQVGQSAGDLFVVVQGLASLVACCAILLPFTWLGLVVLVAAVPSGLAEAWGARSAQRMTEKFAPDRRRFEELERCLHPGPHAAEVRLLGIAPRFVDQLRGIAARISRSQLRVRRRIGTAGALVELVPLCAQYGAYVYLGLLTARGELTFGALTLCMICLHSTQQSMTSSLVAARNLGESLLALRSYHALVDRAEPTASAPAPVARGGLALEDVGFRYPGASTWALRHVDLQIGPTDVVGIVGGNGSGKSTLVRLLTGQYRPTEGRVTLDGRELSTWPEDELRQRLAVVFQQPARYQLSLADNLIGADAEALVASGARELVAAHGMDGMPAGFSGGQWQKLALGRALARRTASLLVLDEPSSSLDEASERRVLEAACGSRTRSVVLVTHRPGALRWVDKLVRLDKGRASPEVL
jgi:ATP-binding cassette, subfamily B, bacterial